MKKAAGTKPAANFLSDPLITAKRMGTEVDIVENDAAVKTPSSVGQGDITKDDYLNEAAQFIRARVRRAAADIIAAGKRLSVAHTRIRSVYGHGHWYPWLQANFGWSVDTADRYIHLAELAKSRNLTT